MRRVVGCAAVRIAAHPCLLLARGPPRRRALPPRAGRRAGAPGPRGRPTSRRRGRAGANVVRGVETVRLRAACSRRSTATRPISAAPAPAAGRRALRCRPLAGPPRRGGLDPGGPDATRRAPHGVHRPRPPRSGVVAPAGAPAGPGRGAGRRRGRRLQRDVAERGRPSGRQLRPPRTASWCPAASTWPRFIPPPSASPRPPSSSPGRSPSRARASRCCSRRWR